MRNKPNNITRIAGLVGAIILILITLAGVYSLRAQASAEAMRCSFNAPRELTTDEVKFDRMSEASPQTGTTYTVVASWGHLSGSTSRHFNTYAVDASSLVGGVEGLRKLEAEALEKLNQQIRETTTATDTLRTIVCEGH